MSPLNDIIVVSVEQAVSAPFASRQLADLGARVIKIERPDGGDFARGYDTTVLGQSSHFIWLNQGKESIAIDLKTAPGREIVERLLQRADVFIQNLAPGAAARLKLDEERLRARFPTLVVGVINGYGEAGPYRERKAYDLLVQAEAGVVSVTGSEDAPAKTGIPVADIAAGMYLYSGILAALLQRQKTGKGTLVAVSMFDALLEWMGYPLLYTKYGGTAPARSGAAHAAIAPYGPFQAGDGETILLAIQNEREWRALCELVLEKKAMSQDPRFYDNSQRVRHRQELEQAISDVFTLYDSQSLVRRLDEAGIAFAQMNSVEQVLRHPQLQARECWHDVRTPAGVVQALRPLFRDPKEQPPLVPALGEHTDGLLLETGYSQSEINDLRKRSIVA